MRCLSYVNSNDEGRRFSEFIAGLQVIIVPAFARIIEILREFGIRGFRIYNSLFQIV